MCSRDLNPGPCACMSNTWPSEPSPQSQVLILFFSGNSWYSCLWCFCGFCWQSDCLYHFICGLLIKITTVLTLRIHHNWVRLPLCPFCESALFLLLWIKMNHAAHLFGLQILWWTCLTFLPPSQQMESLGSYKPIESALFVCSNHTVKTALHPSSVFPLTHLSVMRREARIRD